MLKKIRSFDLTGGAGDPETGSKNTSVIHWDLICDIQEDSEIRVNGDLFSHDGHVMF